MSNKQTYPNGHPCWVDLGTPDRDAAAAFYSGLFGWTIERSDDPQAGGYAMAQIDGDNVAGLGPQEVPGKPFWTAYFSADDADATSAAVKDAGGQVVMAPFDVMEFGRMAIFTDPEGATFSVWQPKAHRGAGRTNTHGSLCWFELYVRDIERAKAFYDSVFGWTARTSPIEGDTSYTEFRPPGADRDVCGMLEMGDRFPAEVPPHWLVYFTVDDCDAAVGKVKELGGSLTHGPQDIPDAGRFAIVGDPQGAVFGVIQLRG